MTSGTNLEIRPGLQDLVREGTLLLRVPDTQNNAEGPTDPQEIQVVTDNNQAITTTEDGTDSEDEEWREHIAHHHAPPECLYCHNCRPIVEEVYYMAVDGERQTSLSS
jgi:hypothetical protein